MLRNPYNPATYLFFLGFFKSLEADLHERAVVERGKDILIDDVRFKNLAGQLVDHSKQHLPRIRLQFEHLYEGAEVDHYALRVIASLGELYGRVHLKDLLWLEDRSARQWLSIVVTILVQVVLSGLVRSYL